MTSFDFFYKGNEILGVHVLKIECYLIDKVFFFQDIKLTAANDDNYFVFEDVLCQVRQNLEVLGCGGKLIFLPVKGVVTTVYYQKPMTRSVQPHCFVWNGVFTDRVIREIVRRLAVSRFTFHVSRKIERRL